MMATMDGKHLGVLTGVLLLTSVIAAFVAIYVTGTEVTLGGQLVMF